MKTFNIFSISKLLLLCATFGMSSAVLAGPKCTDEPQAKWLTPEQMTQKFQALGYKDDVKKLKISGGNCWEIYGTNKEGEKVEVYFHPITGVIVELVKKS